MRLFISILMFSMLFSTSAISSKLPTVDSKQHLVFGSTNPPESVLFKQANLLLSHAFQQLGYQFELRHLPNMRNLVWADSNKLDGIAFRIGTLHKQYPNLVRVNEVLFTLNQYVFSRDSINIQGWQSLVPYRIAYERGTKFIEAQATTLKHLIAVNDSEQAFYMVFHGRADLTITSEKTGQAILTKHQAIFNDLIKQQSPPIVQIALFSYMHKDHHALATQLAGQLNLMKANGEFQHLMKSVQ